MKMTKANDHRKKNPDIIPAMQIVPNAYLYGSCGLAYDKSKDISRVCPNRGEFLKLCNKDV